MGDFISREAALDMCDDDCDIIRIRNIPAADVVEVVRCRDCDSYYPSGCPDGYGTCIAPELYGVCIPEDFFCKLGRRKENADK